MKKLNNKGITTIEVLICFILVVIITVSMYATVSNFNEKKIIEGYKEEIYDYKNTLTKEIQDDFIKIGLTHAKYDKTINGSKVTHTVTCTLKDGTERQLIVEQTLAASSYHIGGSTTEDDSFMIKYGSPSDLIEYPIPELGYSGYNPSTSKVCDADHDSGCLKVQDLSINNVLINITDDNVLSIYIGFYHPELTTKYAINIVCPIDYISSGYDSSSNWNY